MFARIRLWWAARQMLGSPDVGVGSLGVELKMLLSADAKTRKIGIGLIGGRLNRPTRSEPESAARARAAAELGRLALEDPDPEVRRAASGVLQSRSPV